MPPGSYGLAFLGTDGKIAPDNLPPSSGFQLPVGTVYTSILASNPASALGYGTWSAFGPGKVLVGFESGDPDFGTGGASVGAKTVASAGSNSAPAFTGTGSQSTSSDSAGTPTGTNSAPAFTGSPLSGHAHGAGTLVPSAHAGAAVGDHASHTHTYTQVPNHVHVERAQGGTTASTTGTHLMTSASTGGSLRSSAASTLDPTGASNPGTTAGPGATLTHAVTQPSAHTMSGTSESISGGTPAGTVAAPVFTGSAMGTHGHTLTPAGTVAAPIFTGSPTSVIQPSLVVYYWVRTA